MTASPRYPLTMIVDDNELDSFVLKNILLSNGFTSEALLMPDARSALDYLRTNNTAAEKLPRVIFLDIMMPGMDGFEFLEHFEKLPKEVCDKCRIILISTSESFKDLNRANKNRFVYRFLNKPITEAMLNAIGI
jgi:CheY-like chemotaxis protein